MGIFRYTKSTIKVAEQVGNVWLVRGVIALLSPHLIHISIYYFLIGRINEGGVSMGKEKILTGSRRYSGDSRG